VRWKPVPPSLIGEFRTQKGNSGAASIDATIANNELITTICQKGQAAFSIFSEVMEMDRASLQVMVQHRRHVPWGRFEPVGYLSYRLTFDTVCSEPVCGQVAQLD